MLLIFYSKKGLSYSIEKIAVFLHDLGFKRSFANKASSNDVPIRDLIKIP